MQNKIIAVLFLLLMSGPISRIYAQPAFPLLKETVFLPDSILELSEGNIVALSHSRMDVTGTGEAISKALRLSFNLGMLPPNTRIIAAGLQLYYPGDNQMPVLPLKVSLLHLSKTEDAVLLNSARNSALQNLGNDFFNYNITYQRVRKSGKDSCYIFGFENGKPLIPEMLNGMSKDKRVNLLLYTTGNDNATFYGNRANTNFTARLRVVYERSGETFNANDWPQFRNNATNNSQSQWKSSGIITRFNITRIAAGNNRYYYGQQPLMANGMLILPVESTPVDANGQLNNTMSLQAYAPGNPAVLCFSSETLRGGTLNCPLLIDSRNRVICVTGDYKNIEVFNLADHLSRVESVPEIRSGNSIYQQVTALPVSGADGSLYIPTTEGLFAYTPDFQLKWKIPAVFSNTKSHFSTPALDKEEKWLYVIDANNGQLLTVNNSDGTIVNRSDGAEKYSSQVSHSQALPVPVTDILSGNVVAISSTGQLNHLLFYDKKGNKIKEEKAEAAEFSQPVTTPYGICVIRNNHLQLYHGAVKARESVRLPVHAGTAVLLAGANGNIDMLNTAVNNRHLYVFDSLCTVLGEQAIDAGLFLAADTRIAEQNLVKDRLSAAPDGSLYAANTNSIFWFSPAAIINTGPAENTIQAIKDHYVYQSTKTIYTQKGLLVSKGTNALIHNGNGVSVQAGFTVEKGAQFKVSNGLRTDLLIDTAGNVGIGTTSSGAALEISTAAGGFVPSVSSSQEIASISQPTEGTIFYNSTINKLVYYNGKRWMTFDGKTMEIKVGDLLENGNVVNITVGSSSQPAGVSMLQFLVDHPEWGKQFKGKN